MASREGKKHREAKPPDPLLRGHRKDANPPNIHANIRNKNPNMLEGLKEIGDFIGKRPETAKRWILEDGLPATRMPNGMWFTHKGLILQWMVAGHQAEVRNRAQYILEKDEIASLAKKLEVDPDEVLDRITEHEQQRNEQRKAAGYN